LGFFGIAAPLRLQLKTQTLQIECDEEFPLLSLDMRYFRKEGVSPRFIDFGAFSNIHPLCLSALDDG
jgi:hypothetical protein